jgi:hypothetical protein
MLFEGEECHFGESSMKHKQLQGGRETLIQGGGATLIHA